MVIAGVVGHLDYTPWRTAISGRTHPFDKLRAGSSSPTKMVAGGAQNHGRHSDEGSEAIESPAKRYRPDEDRGVAGELILSRFS